ncbi:MAG: hypothetical protein AAGF59_02970 [Pseudomonadota bacterium]
MNDTDTSKQAAARIVSQSLTDSMAEGVSPDVFASTALSVALATLVETHGRDATARMIDRFAEAIRAGKFDSMIPTSH